MTHHDVNAEKQTGTKDETYNLISVLYHALQGAETYAMYARDAQQTGDQELGKYFQQLVDEERARADRARKLLKNRL
jgi:rubrerythrin